MLCFLQHITSFQNLENLSKALIKVGLKRLPHENQYFRDLLTYMGLTFMLEDGKPLYTPMRENCGTIIKLKAPTSVKDCRLFCGLVNFCHPSLKIYENVSYQIINNRKWKQLQWMDECEKH